MQLAVELGYSAKFITIRFTAFESIFNSIGGTSLSVLQIVNESFESLAQIELLLLFPVLTLAV